MCTTPPTDLLSSALFGSTRRALLALLLARPDETFYLRQIARQIDAGQGAVQRELAKLSAAGILSRTCKGKRVYYQANSECPIFPELQSLMRKTAGSADALRRALANLAGAIDCAFIYGSQANGKATARSDVDLLVVGDVDEMSLHRAVSKAEEELTREVNYTLLSRKEFARRRREKGGFLSRVLRGPKLTILGNPDEI